VTENKVVLSLLQVDIKHLQELMQPINSYYTTTVKDGGRLTGSSPSNL